MCQGGSVIFVGFVYYLANNTKKGCNLHLKRTKVQTEIMDKIYTMQQNVDLDKDAFLEKMRKLELAKSGKLHGEAWQHKMKGELDMMREKQVDATRALYTAKTYEYLKKVYKDPK